MSRYVLRRLGLALVTLLILSMVVFLVASVLPGSVGRAILGPFAERASVDKLNAELGFNGPLYERYLRWVGNALTGDFGESYKFRAPVMDFLPTALWASLKLAVVTLLIVVPLGIIGGAIAALRQGRLTDRIITITGLSLAVTPEFVVGIVLILVFAVRLKWLPAGGSPDGSIVDQVRVMILPAVTLSALLFGYIAPDHPCRHHRGAGGRLHAHGDAEGPQPHNGAAASTCCATPSFRPSPSLPHR